MAAAPTVPGHLGDRGPPVGNQARGAIRRVAPAPDGAWLPADRTGTPMGARFLLVARGALAVGHLTRLLEPGVPATSTLIERLVQHRLSCRTEDP